MALVVLALVVLALLVGADGALGPRRLLELKLRPNPPSVTRPRLDKDFAVLLMRLPYKTVEGMAFVAMDEFQRSFFLRRQAEWQDYVESCKGIAPRQGDLQDPAYLDFISFAQVATIADSMRSGQLKFIERRGAEGDVVVVDRPADVPKDNSLLPSEFRRRVGRGLLAFIREFYEAPAGPGLEALAEGARTVGQVFTIKNYGDCSVTTRDEGGGRCAISIATARPATLWGQQVLRGAPVTTDYEAQAVEALLEDAGARAVSLQSRADTISVRHEFRFVLGTA